MQITDNRGRRKKRGVVKKFRIKMRKYAIILSFLLLGTAIFGFWISYFFSDNSKIEKTFYIENENEYVNNPHPLNDKDDKDVNRVVKLAREFLEKKVDEIHKFSKK